MKLNHLNENYNDLQDQDEFNKETTLINQWITPDLNLKIKEQTPEYPYIEINNNITNYTPITLQHLTTINKHLELKTPKTPPTNRKQLTDTISQLETQILNYYNITHHDNP